MKKIYTFEVKHRVAWSRTQRCPKCDSSQLNIWHQIDPDAYIENEDWPWYHAAWFVQCETCGNRTYAFHNKRYAWKAWKDACKNKELKE